MRNCAKKKTNNFYYKYYLNVLEVKQKKKRKEGTRETKLKVFKKKLKTTCQFLKCKILRMDSK